MNGVINISVDEREVRKLFLERVDEMVKKVESEQVFWDANELKRKTCMSWNTIQESFFFDPRFVKVKVGNKWYFPVEDAKSFLRTWLIEQVV